MIRRISIMAAFIVCVGFLTVLRGLAGAGNVAFPQNWAKNVLYMTVDVPLRTTSSATGQERLAEYREFYATPAALAALRKGAPVPSGTVMTLVRYRAKLDGEGNPLKGPNGRFIKGDLYGFGVMEKRTGWGAEYPPELRNGEWEYRYFAADGTPDPKVNLQSCFQCHKPHAKNDYLQSYDKLKAFAAK